MLEGEVERDSGNLAAAMRAFERAVRHDIEFLPEVMPALLNCYEQLGEQSRTKSL